MRDKEVLLTVAQMGAMLSMSRSSAYRLVSSGRLPAVRVLSCIRVRRADVLQFISGTVAEAQAA